MLYTSGNLYHLETYIEDDGGKYEHLNDSLGQIRLKRPKLEQTNATLETGDATPIAVDRTSSRGKAPTRRAGKLRNLMNMPIDIFVEICCNLGPRDLRSMARTTTRLRSILMSKDSRYIWKAVLAREDGLPDCPPDLSEPKYVALLFGTHCFDCCSRFGTRVDFFHCVRYCSTCVDKNMLTASSARKDWPSTVPFTYFERQFCAKVHGELPHLLYGTRRKDMPVLRESFQRFVSRYQELSEDPNGTKRLEEYVQEDAERYKLREASAIAIQKWNVRKLMDRSFERWELRQTREKDVRQKLLDLGWHQDDIPIYNRGFETLIRKPHKLTDKVWDNLRPKLIPFLEPRREDRLLREKQRRQCDRKQSMRNLYESLINNLLGDLPTIPRWEVPQIDDLFAFPPIKTLLDEDTETIHRDQWGAIASGVAELALAHLEERLMTIAKFCGCSESMTGASTLARIKSIVQALDRATSVAWCAPCQCVLHLDNIWYHIQHIQESETQSIVESKNLQQLVAKALKDCGRDPLTTKLSDMANIISFSCARCDPRLGCTGTIGKLMDHWMFVSEWYEDAVLEQSWTHLVLRGSIKSDDEPADIFNDHAWEDMAPLMKELTSDEVSEQKVICEAFKQRAFLHPKSYDENQRGQIALLTCKLCPPGFSLMPCLAPYLEIHIRAKHRMEVFDIEDVSERFSDNSINPRRPCPVNIRSRGR